MQRTRIFIIFNSSSLYVLLAFWVLPAVIYLMLKCCMHLASQNQQLSSLPDKHITANLCEPIHQHFGNIKKYRKAW